MERLLLYLLIIILVAAVDLYSKRYIKKLFLKGCLPIKKWKIHIIYTKNKGIAFSKFYKYPLFVKVFVCLIWVVFLDILFI